jgi:predicted metal-dependent hydrolase
MYLGRQYELLVTNGDIDNVSLSRGKINVSSSLGPAEHEYTKMLVDAWYRTKRNAVFREIYEKILSSFDLLVQPKMLIKPMNKRWGSYTPAGNVVLNPRLIEADKRAIEYVITHELCHVIVRQHNNEFNSLLTSKIPDWEKVKDRLETRHG